MDALLTRLGGRSKVIRILTWAVLVGVVVWIASDAVYFVAFFGIIRSTAPNLTNWLTWVQILNRISYDVWLGSLALLLLIWLTERLSSKTPPEPPGPD